MKTLKTRIILQSLHDLSSSCLHDLAKEVGVTAFHPVPIPGLRCYDACLISDVASDAMFKARVLEYCHRQQIDVAFTDHERCLRDFCLLAMDMDSTLITIECIDEIADMQGLKPQVAAITEAAMRGELDFDQSLRQRVALLKGVPEQALRRVLDERLTLSLGAETLLKAVQTAGLKTLLVSGGFTFFTDHLKKRLGFDDAVANTLDIVNARLTGRVIGPIVNASRKKDLVLSTCQQWGFPPEAAIVMGDGANDLEMMRCAGLSVAFRAKPVVRAQADVAFNFVGLEGLLGVLRNG